VDQLLSHRPVKVRRTLNAAVVALALAMMVTIIPGRQWDVTRPAMAQILPDGALNQLQAIRPGENRVFVPDYMGAYLNWLHPGKNRPFLDARMDAWSPALLRDHISAMLDTSPTIRQEILDRRGVEALVLDYPGMVATLGIAPGLRATAFDPQGPWALVWWDDRAMLFLRRTIAEQRDIPILDLVNPANPGQAIDRAIATLQPGTSQSLLIDSTAAELRRVLEISPENVFAGRLLGYLLARAGRYSEAADAFSETIQRANRRSLPPVRSDYEAWVGTLRDAGRRDEADRAALEMARRFSSP
jgi:tetratricopeptide (TPR) repeat protein